VTDAWATYLCNVNSELASILLNTALVSDELNRAKPELLWIWVYLRDPRHDGLSSSEEAPMLYKIEEALSESLRNSCFAILSGRITTLGRREFYYYGDGAVGFEDSVRAAMMNFSEYRFDFDHQSDPEWSQYLDVLYPTPEQFQQISNQGVLDALAKNGDDHSVVRLVQHWAFFPSDKLRQAFGQSAVQAGFAIDKEYLVETTTPFAICLGKSQSVESHQIDDATLTLFRLYEEIGGAYDGWETFATTGE
jgi:hypothetical protein